MTNSLSIEYILAIYALTTNIIAQTSMIVQTLENQNLKSSGRADTICSGCKTGLNGVPCSGENQGECKCLNAQVVCRCKSSWSGDACQYKLSKVVNIKFSLTLTAPTKITCENMRDCVLCQVYATGPLAERNDCHHLCYQNYPSPLVVKTLYFQEDEHLCSFIYYLGNSTTSLTHEGECRYFFKFGPILHDGTINSSELYLVAQEDMSCGKPAKFPLLRSLAGDNVTFQVFQENYNEVVRASDVYDPGKDFDTKPNLFVVGLVFLLIAVPIFVCGFSLINDLSYLPCGLCNMFRQPSSRYIQNVQPYPGVLAEDASENIEQPVEDTTV